VIDSLKKEFAWDRELGLKRGEIHRVVLPRHIANVAELSDDEKHNGIRSKRCWVPYRKGDPEGNKWIGLDSLFIYWSRENVNWFYENSGKPEKGMPVVRNSHLYFTSGITWSDTGNHVCIKARCQEPCVFDVSGMRLTPIHLLVSANYFLALLNSDVPSYFNKKFYNLTQKYQLGDIRMLPFVFPTREQHARLEQLAERAIQTQTELLTRKRATNAQKDGKRIGELEAQLEEIEAEVNRVVEEIYGVAELGPFEEF
jgi:hypothetical protein